MAAGGSALDDERVSRAIPKKCERLLEFQHGVIARWQADAAGLPPAAMDGWLKSGRWRPLYRGVYAAFTGQPPRRAVLFAAVLRAGPGAALSYHTAAEIDGITDQPAEVVHITVGADRRVLVSGQERKAGLPALVVHRSARIRDALHPARTPSRTRIEETVLDLAQIAKGPEDAFAWAARACGQRLTTPGLLLSAMDARARVRWRAELLAGLADVGQGVLSVLERRYVCRVEKPHGLPVATRQSVSRIGERTRYLDNHYREYRVAVELDGQAAHPAEARWRDIRRDNASATVGLITLRYGWTDISAHPCQAAAEIAATLTAQGWRARPRPCSPACPVLPRHLP